MKKDKNGYEFKRIALSSFLLFLFFSIGTFFVFYQLELNDIKIRRSEITSSETSLKNAEAYVIRNRIDRLTSDLLYIRDSVKMFGLEESGRKELIRNWIAFSDNTKIYDQIRYIDVKGNEIIRVNYYDTGSIAVPDRELQNKSDRYYFTDSINLNPNQIYISKLDLNIEHGSIEKPDKPMIRFIIPYSDEKGQKKGEIVMNYLARNLLDSLGKIADSSAGYTYMLNAGSYWLFNNYKRNTEWAFMYDNLKNINFKKEYPQEWEKFQQTDAGLLITENGFFTYCTILTDSSYVLKNASYSLVLDEGDWRIVSHVRADGNYARIFAWQKIDFVKDVLVKVLPLFVLMWVFSVAITFLAEKNKQRRAKMRYLSEHDEMTGVLNRHTGLERLANLCEEGENNKPFSICFIDINGLKDVNDTFGHESGDRLIMLVTDCLKESVRDTDCVCRLGGDEFMIVCQETDEKGMEAVWKRIQSKFDGINELKQQLFIISASHGVTGYQKGDTDKSMVERADQTMYEEKRRIKGNQRNIISQNQL